MFEILFLGFLIGVSHAFEADHVAAVSSLVSGKSDWRHALRHGAFWGLGHTVMLLAFGALVMFAHFSIGPSMAHGFELLVGLMLILLGAHVLYRLHRDRVHFHRHTHPGTKPHLHLHSHADEAVAHQASPHGHKHPDRLSSRAFVVGIMHGMAGSAALLLVAASSLESTATGMAYIALFGLGSIIGMAGLSAAIAFPMAWSSKALTKVNSGLQITIGILTIGVGVFTTFSSASAFI